MGNEESKRLEDIDEEQVQLRRKRARTNSAGSSGRASRFSSILHLTGNRNSEYRKNIIVAALDIGTSFSGYAVSMLNDYKRNPLDIMTFNWTSRFDGHMTCKTPSNMLLRPDGSFHSFGYEADYNYINLPTGEHSLWYYFKSFKMILYETSTLNRLTKVRDITGKEITALDVFCNCIHFLKSDLMRRLQQQIPTIEEDDFHFVITVPAIWSDKAKQLMRESAEKAGIVRSNLSLALEPEAAAIYCQRVPIERTTVFSKTTLTSAMERDTKYLVIDLGGGTVDITGFHSNNDGLLRQLLSARGGDWGSNVINESFIIYLREVFSDSVIDSFLEKYPDEYIDLIACFERKKIIFDPQQDKKVVITFPTALRTIIKQKLKEEVEIFLKHSKYRDEIHTLHDKLVITRDVFSRFYSKALNELMKHLKCLLTRNTHGIETLLLVGGFANCKLLQHTIKNNFSSFRILIPHDADTAVLKGAILFGRNPHVVKARLIRKTYGVRSVNNYNSEVHPPEKRIVLNGDLVIGNIFDTHIKANQIVEAGQKFAREIYHPVIECQATVTIEIFTADGDPPMFVTDRGCSYLGKLIIELPPFRRSFFVSQDSRKVQVQFRFDGTEIEVEAIVLKTKDTVSSKFDFLG